MSHVGRMISAARACIDTPFHHQGRVAGQGLDCIGLIVVALRAVGFEVNDRTDYGLRPDGVSLVRALEEHGAVRAEEILSGDVLLFRFDHEPQHAALAIDADHMIHSYAPVGKVVETHIGASWQRRLVAIYRFAERA
jgi:cell wall-associated NlpC family hydrolase